MGLIVSTPKTDAAARTIPLPGPCLAALQSRLEFQRAEAALLGEAWEDTGYVFTTPIGTVIDPGNALHWWYKLTETAGVGRRRFHASRHTAAILLLDQGVPLEVVSATLGHASLAITADVYARPTQDAKRRALTGPAEVLGG